MTLSKRLARLYPLTLPELLARQTGISADPRNMTSDGLRYDSKTRRKLDDLARVIAEKKAATP